MSLQVDMTRTFAETTDPAAASIIAAKRMAAPPSPAVPQRMHRDWAATQSAIDDASILEPDAPIVIIIQLHDRPFDYTRLAADVSDDQANAIIAEREAQLTPDWIAAESTLTARGGQVLNRIWLGQSALVAQLPAGEVSSIAVLPSVSRVDIDRAAGRGGVAYHLRNVADAVGSSDFVNDGRAAGRSQKTRSVN